MHGATTRRAFLAAAASSAWTLGSPGWARAGVRALLSTGGTVQSFRSRPDLRPPAIDVTTAPPSPGTGYVFVAPLSGPGSHGPLILDEAGEVVWFREVKNAIAANFRVQRHEGKPVLTWWEGTVDTKTGIGSGECVIADPAYREVARVRAGNGYDADVHEFLLTDRGTALLSVFAERGGVVEGIVQEVDVATGRVLFEWHSLDHVPTDESKLPSPTDASKPWDYFHLNSIDVDSAGNLLVSARHTWAVYSLDRRSGEVLWRLGGTRSDFALGPGADFAWQHDARSHPGGFVSMFDDASGAPDDPQSRALFLELDTGTRTAAVARSLVHPQPVLAAAMGSAQVLPDGGVFVGWGTEPRFTEFAPDGSVRLDATFAGGGQSYRAFRSPWAGAPATRPTVALERGPRDARTLHVSWNGATGVHAWEVLLGPTRDRLRHLRSVGRAGFETTLTLHGRRGWVAVAALDAGRRRLGVSSPLPL